MEILLAIIFLLVCGAIYIAIAYWWVLLIVVGVALLVGLLCWICWNDVLKQLEKTVVRTELINSEPIVERQAENTGFSVGYGRHISSREYYRYRNVITGYNITFRCYFNDGKVGARKCKEGSREYNILIAKVDK